MTDDPFRHHPGLRGKITDPHKSFFRTFQPADIDAHMAAQGIGPDWRYTDETREAFRNAALEGRRDQDLWVFAYGSLMWDPALDFEEVRRARVTGYARRFILKDVMGGRGTAEVPGVMAALDTGPGCDGLVFRIAAARLEEETRILWNRERLSPCYHETFVTAETDQGRVTALAFTADYSARMIVPDLPHDLQVQYAATGAGILGTSLEYLENLAEHFEIMRIEDHDLTHFLAEVHAYRAANGGPPL
ncbi:gamma-glutamylcyclotransferase [Pseudoruegeria sp. HB172150]|uniref:gamma-glutamylcyclotransferase n=1 Tax=Pseudoruegeria sp. HB172150 TaxID=2721164 RepID=UPI001557D2E3|nr:gamma-glutamylcyclotransferase [Pseudoruegeria sp. HB172150]